MPHDASRSSGVSAAAWAALALSVGLLAGDARGGGLAGRWEGCLAAAGVLALGALVAAPLAPSGRGATARPWRPRHLEGERARRRVGACFRASWALLLLLAFALVGFVRGGIEAARWDRERSRLPALEGEAWVAGRSEGEGTHGSGAPRAARLERVRSIGSTATHEVRPHVRLLWASGGAEPPRGARWAGFARIEAGEAPGEPGGFSAEGFLRSRGAQGWLRPLLLRSGPDTAARRRLPASGALSALARLPAAGRAWLNRRLADRLSPNALALARGLLVGRTGAEREDAASWATFQQAGVGHLFAVSGLHVGIVAALAGALLGLCPLPRGTRLLLLAALLLFYGALAGWSPSVTRAVAAATLWAILTAAGRQPQPASIWLLVLAGNLWARPGAWRETGFQLSYLVTLALIGAAREMGRAPARRPAPARCVARLARGAGFVLAAQCAAWPLLLAAQGSVSLLYLAGNALLVPLAGVLVGAVLLGLLAGLLPGYPADLAASPVEALFAASSWLARPLARLADATPLGGDLPRGAGLCGALACGILWHLPRLGRGARLALAAGLCALMTLAAVAHAPRNETILLRTVGQGESWLLLWPGETWVIDVGPPWPDPARAADRLVRALHRHGRGRIDRLFLTHDDSDHSGALPGLAARGFTVARIHPPRGWSPSAATSSAIDAWREKGARLEPLARGDTLRAHAATLVLLHPPPGQEGGDRNAGGLALELRLRDLALLVSADAPSQVMEDWCRRGLLSRCDIVSAGHHGSAGSTPAALLAAVSPSLVLVSVGAGNRYGHPAPEVLARVSACGAALLRTDIDGEIRLARSGDRWEAVAYRSRRRVELRRDRRGVGRRGRRGALEGAPRACYKGGIRMRRRRAPGVRSGGLAGRCSSESAHSSPRRIRGRPRDSGGGSDADR